MTTYDRPQPHRVEVNLCAWGTNDKYVAELVLGSLELGANSPALETVFRELNHVDGTEWIAGKAHRSLSVGDEFTIAGRTFKVEGMGFSEKIGGAL